MSSVIKFGDIETKNPRVSSGVFRSKRDLFSPEQKMPCTPPFGAERGPDDGYLAEAGSVPAVQSGSFQSCDPTSVAGVRCYPLAPD